MASIQLILTNYNDTCHENRGTLTLSDEMVEGCISFLHVQTPLLSGTQGLKGCRQFLALEATDAIRRAAQVIEQQFLLLESNPNIGRPNEELPELRELVIPFGDSGYVAPYHYEPTDDKVYILPIRHQKEAGD